MVGDDGLDKTASVTRIVKHFEENAITGAIGTNTICAKYLEWAETGNEFEFEGNEEESFQAIWIDEDGIKLTRDASTWFAISADFYAIGDGAAMAIGAMAAGASAIQAVEICIKHSATCGGALDHEKFSQNDE